MSEGESTIAALRAKVDELRASMERDQEFTAAVAVFAIETHAHLRNLWVLIDRRLLAHGGGSDEVRRITSDLDSSLAKLDEQLKAQTGAG